MTATITLGVRDEDDASGDRAASAGHHERLGVRLAWALRYLVLGERKRLDDAGAPAFRGTEGTLPPPSGLPPAGGAGHGGDGAGQFQLDYRPLAFGGVIPTVYDALLRLFRPSRPARPAGGGGEDIALLTDYTLAKDRRLATLLRECPSFCAALATLAPEIIACCAPEACTLSLVYEAARDDGEAVVVVVETDAVLGGAESVRHDLDHLLADPRWQEGLTQCPVACLVTVVER